MSEHKQNEKVTFITNASQLAPPPPLRRDPIDQSHGLRAVDGGLAQLFAQELTAYGFGEYQASLRNEDGNITNKTYSHNNLKFLSRTVVDTNGHLIWQTEKEAIEQLGQYGQSIIDVLFSAAVKVNAVDTEAVERAEKNSEGITSK